MNASSTGSAIGLILLKQITLYAAGAATALVGWLLNVSQLYWMAGVLLLLPYASRWVALLERRSVQVFRTHPAAGHQGESLPVRLRVASGSRLPRLHLSVRDRLPPGLTADDPEPLPVHLPPYGADEVSYELGLRRRGLHTIPAVELVGTDPLGLATLSGVLPVETRVLVYPRAVEPPLEWLPGGWGGGQAPLETSRDKGEGSSFFGTREYRPGDPLRHVHWRTAARQGRLAVVEWEAEESREVLLAFETLRGTPRPVEGEHDTLDLAAGAGASVARSLLASGDALRLLIPGLEGWEGQPLRGGEQLSEVMERLARMQAEADQPLAATLRLVAPTLAPGTTIYWFTPVPGPELLEGVRFLRAARFQPVVAAVLPGPLEQDRAWKETRDVLLAMEIPVLVLTPEDPFGRRLLE